MNLQRLLDLGFGAVRCSQCEAMVINGVPCHETGCPNVKYERECLECGTTFIAEHNQQVTCSHHCRIEYWGLYCECDECCIDED